LPIKIRLLGNDCKKNATLDPYALFFDEFSNFYGEFLIDILKKITRKPEISFTENKVSLMIMNITVISYE